ncbi:hypothetical protein RND81_06G199700 [Saponaria officinalis]|uniref:DYW domain-containing protein n=1 Tax=Saponaria officinalis TaxID=3572 RepID=A0AAW1K8G2_SAPOF
MEALTFPNSPPYLYNRGFLPVKELPKYSFRPRVSSPVTLISEDVSLSNHHVLDTFSKTDTFAWNHLIKNHLANGDVGNVMYIYEQMLMQGICPDKHTLPRVLAAAQLSNSLLLGRQVHCHAVKLGISSEDYVMTALMKMYGQLDGADTVKQIFDAYSLGKSSISGTLLISMYLKEHNPRLAVDLFYQMVASNSQIDAVAIMTAIGACGMLQSPEDGRKVHKIAKACGLECQLLVSNALLKMYLDFGNVDAAREVFDNMSSRDTISWTEMIRGYVKNGGFNESLKLFKMMVSVNIKPDPPALSTILPACARMTAHKQGKEIHGYMLRNGVDMNLTVQNALLDMYIKSGYMESASAVFNQITCKDAITWTIMIYGCGLHGQGAYGVELYHEMFKNNVEIDGVAFSSVLHACVAANFVDEGRSFFSLIKKPEIRHYTSMVSLLARAGLFKEAEIFIEENRIGKHIGVLRALLDGCRIHRNIYPGKKVAEQLCHLEPFNADNYVLLSNWYASNGKWDMARKSKEMITDLGLVSKRAYSWIEFRNKIHVFGTGDTSHPISKKLYRELQRLVKKMEEEGYAFDPDFSLHDVDEERECLQIGLSELLAISFGLISTVDSTVRVTKNLRVCRNSHAIAKAMSRLVGREIVVKDPSCFHHFKDGHCSCGDSW